MQTRPSLRTDDGPGALTLAWLGAIALIVLCAAVIQFWDWSGDEDDTVRISLGETPERFARPTQETWEEGPAMARAAETPLSADAEPETTPETMPEVRAARPGEIAALQAGDTPAGTETVETPEQAIAAAGEGAAIIRLEDLPRAGDTGETTTAGKPVAARNTAIRIAGTAPPPPDAALFSRAESGPMPRIAADGRRPSRYYRRSFAASEGAPRIGLSVSGLGLSTTLTDDAIKTLPPEATLAFAPYARNLERIAGAAREAGHETMIELPMEASNVDAQMLGAAALMTDQSRADTLQRLDWILTRFAGYIGVTNYLGTTFSDDAQAMAPVIDRLRQAGLSYVSDTDMAPGLGTTGVPTRRTDFLLSGRGDDISGELERLEQGARARGAVLAKVYVTEDNLPVVAAWASGLKDRGVALAPASALIDP